MMQEESWLDELFEAPSNENDLRLEAMELFDRCLAHGSPDCLIAFIEAQITQDPPRLDVLRDLAEDLHQRLLGLRGDCFDVRERVLRTLRDDFHVDLSPIAPANAIEVYHQLNPDTAVHFLRCHYPQLTQSEELVVRRLLETSLMTATRLHSHMRMTEELFAYVMDWMEGLNTVIARQLWDIDPPLATFSGLIH